LINDRAGRVLLQMPVDIPDQFLALFLVRLDRLLLVHFFELGIAVVRVIALGAAGIVLIEIGVRIVDPRPVAYILPRFTCATSSP
jgi:hypothetical protein